MKPYEMIKDSINQIFAFALKRTKNREEAEDLAQEIILNLYQSIHRLKDVDKFYGWMWAVSQNVYKTYLRKKVKQNKHQTLEENIHFVLFNPVENKVENKEDINLLYRELSIMSGLYREVTVLYYMQEKSCEEIAQILSLTSNMVKQYLFKSRKKIKDGMNLIRELGERSFNPKKFMMSYWGEDRNHNFNLFGRKLPGNILQEAYYEPLTIEQLSIELGVASVYLEDEINLLIEEGLILKNGHKYQTNMVILTQEFEQELLNKTSSIYSEVASEINEFIKLHSSMFKKYFKLSENGITWQITTILLMEAVLNKLISNLNEEVMQNNPKGFVWGLEREYGDYDFDINVNGYWDQDGNYLNVIGYHIVDKNYHALCNKEVGEVIIKVAQNKTDFTTKEEEIISDLICEGYIEKVHNTFGLTIPVLSETDYKDLLSLMDGKIQELYQKVKSLVTLTEIILENYTPKHLHDQIKGIARLKLVETMFVITMNEMYKNNYIYLPKPNHEILSMFIVLVK